MKIKYLFLFQVSLILFKAICFRLRFNAVEKIIEKLEKLNALVEDNTKFQSIMKLNFIQDFIIFLLNFIVGMLLSCAIAMQPYFNEYLSLPLRVKFPYFYIAGDGETSSVYYITVYVFQIFITTILIQSIVYMDQVGGSIVKLITVHFEMLVEKFRHLNEEGYDYSLYDLIREHQYIIWYKLKILKNVSIK